MTSLRTHARTVATSSSASSGSVGTPAIQAQTARQPQRLPGLARSMDRESVGPRSTAVDDVPEGVDLDAGTSGIATGRGDPHPRREVHTDVGVVDGGRAEAGGSQSTTPLTLPRDHRTLPAWWSRWMNVAVRQSTRAVAATSKARSHNLGWLLQAGGFILAKSKYAAYRR